MKKRILTTLCLLVGLFISITLTGCNNDYDVKLIVDGRIYETVLFEDLSTVENPAKLHFNFEGWYLYGEDVPVNLEEVDESCTLYAKWSLKEGYVCIEVLTNSMVPTFYNGDYLVVDTNATIQVGDIVVYEATRNGQSFTVAHRILSIDAENGQYTMKGDANTADEVINEEQIVGQVCEVLTKLPDLID